MTGKVIALTGRGRPGKPAKRLNVGIVAQARMTSSRFPGKTLELLGDKPVIEHVIDNCLKIRPKTRIVIAVPDEPESQPLLEFIDSYNQNQITNFLGSRDNVLERYYRCAQFFKFDIIMRVTGDCPFINPKVASEVLELILDQKYDYTSNIFPERSFPKGYDCECFTFDCLEAAYLIAKEASQSPIQTQEFPKRWEYWQEHVTPWMQEKKGVIKGLVKQKKNDSEINLCVDYPEDIERLKQYLPTKPKIVKSDTIVILEKNND